MRQFLFLMIVSSGLAIGQKADSGHVGIHEIEASEHRWDVLRTDPRVPELERGKEFARQGRFEEAEREFRKAYKSRRALVNFNIGVLELEQKRYQSAAKYFRTAYRLKRDPQFYEYLRTARRMAGSKQGRS